MRSPLVPPPRYKRGALVEKSLGSGEGREKSWIEGVGRGRLSSLCKLVIINKEGSDKKDVGVLALMLPEPV
jgi:hypothetical protein